MKYSWKRLLAMLVTVVMMLSVAVPFASAEGGEKKLTVGIYGGLDSLNPWTSGRITNSALSTLINFNLSPSPPSPTTLKTGGA